MTYILGVAIVFVVRRRGVAFEVTQGKLVVAFPALGTGGVEDAVGGAIATV
jgi:hypothetical protein